jgi:hypothetical protein
MFRRSNLYVFLLAVNRTNLSKLNQSNLTVLHWFYLVTDTCFDSYLDHKQAVFLNMSYFIIRSNMGLYVSVKVSCNFNFCLFKS